MKDYIKEIEERLKFVDSLKTEQTYNVNHGFYCQQLEDIQNLIALVKLYEEKIKEVGIVHIDDGEEYINKERKKIFEKEVKK